MCGFSSKTKLKDLDDLKTELINAWNDVPLHYLHNLYGSILRRIRQVLVQKSHITNIRRNKLTVKVSSLFISLIAFIVTMAAIKILDSLLA